MCNELQTEELEVLRSIYEGDDKYSELPNNVFQYKFDENDEDKAFLLEISWGEEYPDALPNINLDAFYNKHIAEEVKKCIVSKVMEEADQLIGFAMTYSLFEWVKENQSDLMAAQPDVVQMMAELRVEPQAPQVAKVKVKKEQFTKSQKRRMYNQLDSTGEKPRGFDWVDIVRHLSRTGGKED